MSNIRDNRKLEGNSCQPKKEIGTLTFTVVENDATGLAIEDDIRNNLAELGIKVETKLLSKDDWNKAQVDGEFHLSFTESWGAPYDPHSYGMGWDGSGGEGHKQAFSSFDKPSSRNELFDLIKDVTKEEDHKKRRTKWENIHNYYHAQAVMLPLWGKRIPTLMNSRLSGYQAGHQQFDYPVHKLVPITGSSNITIAPGAQTGLFQTVGRLDPHTYRPVSEPIRILRIGLLCYSFVVILEALRRYFLLIFSALTFFCVILYLTRRMNSSLTIGFTKVWWHMVMVVRPCLLLRNRGSEKIEKVLKVNRLPLNSGTMSHFMMGKNGIAMHVK